MELLLNAMWLMLALAMLACSLSCRYGEGNRLTVRGLLAIGCVLALIFPVISMTDDLASQQVAVEINVASKKLSNGSGRTAGGESAAAVRPWFTLQNSVRTLGTVAADNRVTVESRSASPNAERAPPLPV
jgi:hypothetical protein